MANNDEAQIPALKLLIPGSGWEQEVFIPAEFVESVILPAVEHEVGHIVAAAHFGAVTFGIGLGPISERSTDGWLFQAIYGWEVCPVETKCIVMAAGPAADLLYRGRIDDKGASGDLNDIEALTSVRSLEPYLSRATELLSGHRNEIGWVAERLRAALLDGEWRRMIRLPNGRMAALFIDEAKLRECP
ncbi:MAG: hypothetical protein ABSA54_16485 [Terriglobales bacterium]